MSSREPNAAPDLVRLLAFAPKPSDGPDYHADLAAWTPRVRDLGATDYEIEEATQRGR